MLCPRSLIDIKCLSLTQNSPSISPHCYLYIYATYLNLDKLSLSTVISHCHRRVFLRSAAPSSAGLLPAECRDSVAPSSGHQRTRAVSPAASAVRSPQSILTPAAGSSQYLPVPVLDTLIHPPANQPCPLSAVL